MKFSAQGEAGRSERDPIVERPSQVREAAFASVLTAVGGQGVLIVSGVVVARLLGPENRGHLALVVLLPVVLVQMANLGLPQAVTYYTAKDVEQARGIARSILRSATLQALVIVGLHVLLLPVFLRGSSPAVWTAGVLTLAVGPAALAHQYALALLQGQRRFAAFNVLRVLPATVYSAAALLLLIFDVNGLVFVALAWVLATVLVASSTVSIAVRGLSKAGDGDAPPKSEMLRFGLRGFLGSVSPVQTFRLDQAVIGLFLSPVALGLYVVGLAFTNLPRFIAQSIGTVAYPHIAAQAGGAAAWRSAWRFTVLTVGACALVVAPLWLAAGFLVPFFFGKDFADSVAVTRILLTGSLFAAGRLILSDATRGLGLPHLSSIAEVTSWAWLFPALAILAPAWGIRGVALALATSSAVSLFVLVGLAVRGMPLPVGPLRDDPQEAVFATGGDVPCNR